MGWPFSNISLRWFGAIPREREREKEFMQNTILATSEFDTRLVFLQWKICRVYPCNSWKDLKDLRRNFKWLHWLAGSGLMWDAEAYHWSADGGHSWHHRTQHQQRIFDGAPRHGNRSRERWGPFHGVGFWMEFQIFPPHKILGCWERFPWP